MKGYQNPEVLKKLYWEEGLSSREIGQKFGITGNGILYLMKKYGILRRSNRKYQFSKEELVDLYLNKKLSTHKIAKLLGIKHPRTVTWLLNKLGIKRRSHSQALRKYERIPFFW